MCVNMNSNYPDGTWEGDPSAPWNQPEEEEDYYCESCVHYHEYPHRDADKWGDSILYDGICARCFEAEACMAHWTCDYYEGD